MDIYPGGSGNSDDGYVAIDLSNMSNKSIEIEYGYSVRDAAGKEVVHRSKPKTYEFGGDGKNSWGCSNLTHRSSLLADLIGGTLIIVVRMKLIEASKLSTQFIPTNPLNKYILNKFNIKKSQLT